MNSKIFKTDEAAMLHAISLGEKARVIAPPNPWVGCVITQDGRIIGEGYTQQNGIPHAETVALEAAGTKSKGATVYVSLEPCSHYGRTPPCAKALIQAEVSRVVIALEDPDHRVKGGGIQMLRNAGIKVDVGIESASASQSLEAYLWQRKTGSPFCFAKSAISIDGRIAAVDGSSQWITSPEARLDAHRLRAESQAIMIGIGTALSDKPALTVRHVEKLPAQQPLRVVLDSMGRLLAPCPLLDTSQASTLIFTTDKCPAKIKTIWIKAGIEVIELPYSEENEGIDLHAALKILGKRGIIQVLIEGGSTLIGNMLKQHLINRLALYVGPCILGETGLALFKNVGVKTLDEAPKLSLINGFRIGDCFRLDYSPLPLSDVSIKRKSTKKIKSLIQK